MGANFWVKRFLVVLAGGFAITCAAQLLKGHDVGYAVVQGALWGAIAASVFTISRLYQSSKGRHCAICKDTPAMQQPGKGSREV